MLLLQLDRKSEAPDVLQCPTMLLGASWWQILSRFFWLVQGLNSRIPGRLVDVMMVEADNVLVRTEDASHNVASGGRDNARYAHGLRTGISCSESFWGWRRTLLEVRL